MELKPCSTLKLKVGTQNNNSKQWFIGMFKVLPKILNIEKENCILGNKHYNSIDKKHRKSRYYCSNKSFPY